MIQSLCSLGASRFLLSHQLSRKELSGWTMTAMELARETRQEYFGAYVYVMPIIRQLTCSLETPTFR